MARYDYDEFDNLISAEYERGGEVERLYRVPDRMGNLFESREKDDRKYDAGGRLAEDREFFYHYDCEGNLVFKEFKELSWGGNVIAPINKERLETELGIRFRAFGTGWRYDWQSDGMLARVVRPDGKEVSFAYDALGRRIRKTYSCLPPSLLPMATASPSSPTTSVRPCKPTTNKETRFGNKSWTSTAGKENGHPRSFHSSTKGSTRMQKRGYITIGSGITTRMGEVTSAKTR